MSSSNFAPVILTVYDRPEHLRQCVESLAKNIGADKTVLFISSDGPRDDRSRELIGEVRAYIKSIRGFKKVVAYTPKENTGGAIRKTCRDEVREKYDRYIRLEDDNLLSPYFLEFINEGLELYEQHPQVMAICGYQNPGFPWQDAREQIFLNAYSTWGFGVWRDKDLTDKVVHTRLFDQVMTDRDFFDRVNHANPALPLMIYHQYIEGKRAGDLANNILIQEQNLLCVFPTQSLVKNIGNDGTGVNCYVNEDLQNQEICEEKIHYDPSKAVTLDTDVRQWHFKQKGGNLEVLANRWLFQSVNNDFLLLRKYYSFLFWLKGKIKGTVKKRLGFIIQFPPNADLP